VAVVTLVALGVELWAGATLSTHFGGAVVQDRFALFAKAAALLAVAVVLMVVDWTAEDSVSIGLAMPLLAAFGVMVAASAGDLVSLWAGLELAAAAGVVMVALRRPDLALRLLVSGGVASSLLLIGLAFLYATVGTPDLSAMREVVFTGAPTIALAIPVFLAISGLALRATLAPFHLAGIPSSLGASPLGAGLVLGLVAAAAAVVAIKLAAVLTPIPTVYSSFLEVIAAVAMVGGGAAALAVRSPRMRIAYLAAGQIGWVAAGLVTHYRAGLAASLFLLGAFAVAATCAPAVMGRADGGEPALAGMGVLRPARAAGLALAMLSLAGAPPLAGFFGEFAIAAQLARGGLFWLVAVGFFASAVVSFAVLRDLRLMFLASPGEHVTRTVHGRLAYGGALVAAALLVAYGFFANPISGLAVQGAAAVGLR
jgi:NADH-quinone oxidoreductase subunit N